MSIDLDALIDDAAAVGLLAGGAKPDLLAAQGFDKAHKLASIHGVNGTGLSNSWSQEEVDQLKNELGQYPIEVIARRHGRSVNAIKVKYTRLGLDAPSKQPDEVTAWWVGYRLGMCGKAAARLIDLGILPGRVTSTAANIRTTKEVTLRRFVCNPGNWIYFKYENMRDPHLKQLVKRQRERWCDEWWTTGQVAAYHGLTSSNVINRRIRRGEMPAVRWQNWQVLKSVAVSQKFYTGKGNNHLIEWSREGDRFIVFAFALGLRAARIGEVNGMGEKRVTFRLQTLQKRADWQRVALSVGVQHRDGLVWGDWRKYRHRFPGLLRSAQKLNDGNRLRTIDVLWMVGIMYAWATWFAETPEQKRMAKRLKHSGKYTERMVRLRHQELVQWCPDPFDLSEE